MGLKRIELENFKAFERLSVNFGSNAFVVGPNNAGKSTLLSAIRLASGLLRQASRAKPNRAVEFRGRQYVCYGFDAERLGLVEENLRHEFRNVETVVRVIFASGASLTAVWPAEPEDDADEEDSHAPFFFVDRADRAQPRTPAAVRETFPVVGVIPMLAPIERTETLLEKSTVTRNIAGRLASRHFRNQLNLLTEPEFEQYLAFVSRWTPEISLRTIERRMTANGYELDLFFEDEGRRSPKEICWAGDGLQVWLQLLQHLHRLQNADVIVLDEPDIYLHADLQRRLVRVLEESSAQTILATHSPEVLGEAHTENVIWVDKSRRRGVRGSDGLAASAEAIGSQFNVRIARALRSKVALFVEGKDMKVLRSLANAAGADQVSQELGLVVVPLEGFSNRTNVTPFKILIDEFLEGSVASFVILDRDYRTDEACRAVVAEFDTIGIGCHVWARKELESYLLAPSLLARVSGVPVADVTVLVKDIVESMRGKVFARALAAAEEELVGPKMHRVNIIEHFEPRFAAAWSDGNRRLGLVPPKEVIGALNAELTTRSGRSVTALKLAKAIRPAEIDAEVMAVFDRIEELLAAR